MRKKLSTDAFPVFVGIVFSAICIFLLRCERSNFNGESTVSGKNPRLILRLEKSPQAVRFLFDDYPETIEVDAQGNRWIGTSGGDVIKISADGSITQWELTELGLNEGHDFRSFKFDDTGNLWGCNNGSGLYKYDGNTWARYTTENSGLPYNFVFGVAFEKGGVIWIASESKCLTSTAILLISGVI